MDAIGDGVSFDLKLGNYICVYIVYREKGKWVDSCPSREDKQGMQLGHLG